MSFITIGVPLLALWYAIPPPMIPAPSTAAELTGWASLLAFFALPLTN